MYLARLPQFGTETAWPSGRAVRIVRRRRPRRGKCDVVATEFVDLAGQHDG